MEILGGSGGAVSAVSAGPDGHDAPDGPDARDERTLAAAGAARLGRLIGLFRSLSPPSGLGLTAAATLATLERSGPYRLTALAVHEGGTQPAMTPGVARLQESGLVGRTTDPADGRVVQVSVTEEGRTMLARRRAVRAERLADILARL